MIRSSRASRALTSHLPMRGMRVSYRLEGAGVIDQPDVLMGVPMIVSMVCVDIVDQVVEDLFVV